MELPGDIRLSKPIIFNNGLISLPTYQTKWKVDVGAGTWTTF